MPVYNAAGYLRESIESVLMQTFLDFEFIIIDDGSTDDSFEIVKLYHDTRIIAHKLAHNYIASLNYGMRLARGKYIARMDSDDKMLPDRLQRQFEYMESHGHVAVCGSWMQTFGEDDKIYKLEVEHNSIICRMLLGNPICHSSVIMRRCVLEAIFYDNGLEVYNQNYIYAEDYKLWYDIIVNGGVLANIDEVLLMYRCSENQLSCKEGKESFKSGLKVRMDYLKEVCRQMAQRDHLYIQILGNLFTLQEKDKIDFYLLCNIVKLLYNNYLVKGCET